MADREVSSGSLRVRLRLDFRGERAGRFLFGGRNSEQQAEEVRERYVSLVRNVPFQGITIENVDAGHDIYVVRDEDTGEGVAYAPVIITFTADTIEDLARFILRSEFRKIEILEPEELVLSRQSLERLLFRISEEMEMWRQRLERASNR